MICDCKAKTGRLCQGCKALRHSRWYEQKKKSKLFKKKRAAYMREWRKANKGYTGRKTPQQYDPDRNRNYHARYRSKPEVKAMEQSYNKQYYAANRERILEHKKRRKIEHALKGIRGTP